jgi:hypothetical protein
MKEIVINTTEVRKDIGYIETKDDIMTVLREVDYLADEATARLEFALVEANESLFSIRALKNRPIIIEKPADQL